MLDPIGADAEQPALDAPRSDGGEPADPTARETAALRRVATLVAEGASVTDVFRAASEEIASAFGLPSISIDRFDPGRMSTVVASLNVPGFQVGGSWPIDGPCLSGIVLDTGRPARIDDYSALEGTIAASVRESGVWSAAGAPILVDGAVWGMIWAGTAQDETLPDGIELRLVDFTELVGIAVSQAEARDRRRRLTDQEASLRRVATLVAEGALPADVFAAVAEEAVRILDVSSASVVRYEEDGTSIVVASVDDPSFPVGSRWSPDESSLNTKVRNTVRPARIDDFADVSGPVATAARETGVKSGIGVPVAVDGAVWGMVAVGRKARRREGLPGFTGSYTGRLVLSTESPEDIEARLIAFTELVAAAISRTQAIDDVRRLADEQAALHRVATLVAEGAVSASLYTAVLDEAGQVLRAPAAWLLRYDPDGSMEVLAARNDPAFPVGSRWPLDGASVSAAVFKTGRPARIDDFSNLDGVIAARTRVSGYRSSVGVPITVDGAVWGAICIGTSESEPLPLDSENRLGRFTELVATAISNVHARENLRVVAKEQAALRRVATLVAHDASPEEVFEAVAVEVGEVLDASLTVLGRYDADGAIAIGTWSASPPGIPVGTRTSLGGRNVTTIVAETGKPARLDDYEDATGEAAEIAHRHSWRSSIAAPIVVEGRLWGVMLVAITRQESFPPGAEVRLAAFTELVATAVANAMAHTAVRVFADEQAALRRVATLVAGAASPADVFAAVTEEVGRQLGDVALLERADPDGAVVLVGAWSAAGTTPALGARPQRGGQNLSTIVLETGRPARMGSYADATGEPADVARAYGLRSSVGAPIHVEGRLWGLVIVGNTRDEPMPADAEARLAAFTELVATAIGNATARSELIVSRARIVAAGDDARRRVERDLHDGTQQRLVALRLDLQRLRATVPEDGEDVRSGLEHAVHDLESIVEEVRELSRGLHPAQLSRGGLGPSLRALVQRAPVDVELAVDVVERPSPPIETAAYYVVSEALTNTIKHSQATAVSVRVVCDTDGVTGTISDDGVGGADAGRGSGLTGLSDRIEALGGRFTLESPPGGGTIIRFELPVDPPQPA